MLAEGTVVTRNLRVYGRVEMLEELVHWGFRAANRSYFLTNCIAFDTWIPAIRNIGKLSRTATVVQHVFQAKAEIRITFGNVEERSRGLVWRDEPGFLFGEPTVHRT